MIKDIFTFFNSISIACSSPHTLTGQIELYTHLPVMRQLVEQLQQWEFRVCGVFLVDSQFMVESFKVTFSLLNFSYFVERCFLLLFLSIFFTSVPLFFFKRCHSNKPALPLMRSNVSLVLNCSSFLGLWPL